MNFAQKCAEAVEKSIQTVSDKDLNMAHSIRNEELDHRDDIFFEVAGVIVEPQMDKETKTLYGEWMDDDILNWANWIRNTFGTTWGDIADIISTEGY